MKNLVLLDYLISKINSISKLKNKIIEVGYAKYPHKYYVIFKKDNKRVNFGHQEYQDTLYRTYKNMDIEEIEKRKRLYHLRHENEKTQSIDTPGFLSYFILW